MIEIKNFTKKYGDSKVAVDNLTLTIEDGDIYGFIGHNGAGKSTTLKACVGILDFNDGEILINGKSIKRDPLECKKQIAYIPDNPDLYESMTGIKYLNFICDMFEVPGENRKNLIEKYATIFEIKNDLSNQIKTYSHGMKQKIAIISALCHDPKIIIFDEPFVGLDPKASHTIKEIMKEKAKDGCSIFFSSHVLEVVEKLCNKVAIIKNGKLEVFGDTEEVRGNGSLENLFLELSE